MRTMSDASIDPRWPKLLSLTVHEFRTPMTVVAGYIRMLLKDRAGPLSEQQRRLLEEAEKSCGRLSALLAEVGEIANAEGGRATYNRGASDLRTILQEAVDRLPPLPDRTVDVDVTTMQEEAPIDADAVRLRGALASIIAALRREVVASDVLRVELRPVHLDGGRSFEILVGDDETVALLRVAGAADLPVFDEWRGGSGLSLPIARRVLNAHGGTISGAPGERPIGARLLLPSA